jgi:hypothetical protein
MHRLARTLTGDALLLSHLSAVERLTAQDEATLPRLRLEAELGVQGVRALLGRVTRSGPSCAGSQLPGHISLTLVSHTPR